MTDPKKEQRIEAILDAVIACRIEAGARPVQAAQIAAKAGVSTRTINRYFPNKDIMLFEASAKYLTQRLALVVSRCNRQLPSDASGCDRLLSFLRSLIVQYRSDIDLATLFMEKNVSCAYISMTTNCRRATLGGEIRRILEGYLSDGLRDGSIRPHLDVDRISLMIAANLNGLMQRVAFLRDVKPQRVTGDSLLSVFDDYIDMLARHLQP